ncbi:MAG: dTDP-4-dehydrorhamnose 3,5-epimerase [Pseudomonas sp.]|nr:MAG: dTDP-4-dehydrorhamnose 3,5-epimerase [Pseudomonas sp.]
MMKITKTAIPEVLVFEPRKFEDERGFFFESFNRRIFNEAVGSNIEFVQDNHSRSAAGVLRGLHYQIRQSQGKLVRAIKGAVFDVAVDIRKDSPTLGHWVGVELTEHNHKQVWIPVGFAHGFMVLSESADVQYKTSDYYAPKEERCIVWNDKDLGIDWPQIGRSPVLSEKDFKGVSFSDAELM